MLRHSAFPFCTVNDRHQSNCSRTRVRASTMWLFSVSLGASNGVPPSDESDLNGTCSLVVHNGNKTINIGCINCCAVVE